MYKRETYKKLRDEGLTPRRALALARGDYAVRLALKFDHDPASASYGRENYLWSYAVDTDALFTVTGAGRMHSGPHGSMVDTTVYVPEGATVKVHVYHDHASTPYEWTCYSDEDAAAWLRDEWSYFGVAAEVTLADERHAEAVVWGVDAGDYFPGSTEAQLWDFVVQQISEAVREALDEDPPQTHSDRDAVDAIAILLGTSPTWSSDYLETIADIVGKARPHPGDKAETYVDDFERATGRPAPLEYDSTPEDDEASPPWVNQD